MKYELIIKPEAKVDIEISFDWYELQSDGLGHDFVYCVEETLESIGIVPFGYQLIYRTLRRATVHRFPHSILYSVEGQMINVVACVHQKRDPKIWKRRR